MIIIGLLVLAAIGVAGTWLYLGATNSSAATSQDLSAWGVTIGFRPLVLLIAGAGMALGLLLGLYLIRAGLARNSRLRRERKELQRAAEANRKATEEDAGRRLQEERSARGGLDPEPFRTADGQRADGRGSARPFTGPTDEQPTTPPPPPPPPRG
ncbi:MAG: hypothetical protein IPH03_04090 [Tetrasphaera sp.]|jgi:hypothetical protein|nr:hypothetical protein [Tetrasphaera sp.]